MGSWQFSLDPVRVSNPDRVEGKIARERNLQKMSRRVTKTAKYDRKKAVRYFFMGQPFSFKKRKKQSLGFVSWFVRNRQFFSAFCSSH